MFDLEGGRPVLSDTVDCDLSGECDLDEGNVFVVNALFGLAIDFALKRPVASATKISTIFPINDQLF